MIQNLKLLLSLFVLINSFSGCYDSEAAQNESLFKSHLVVVVDKSVSVTYNNRFTNIQENLKSHFKATYDNVMNDIQFVSLIIDGNTRVVPEYNHFENNCPYIKPETLSQKKAIGNWKQQRNKWLHAKRLEVERLVQQPPTSRSTDIFSALKGIQLTQSTNGPWNKINVLIFSDMIHTIDGQDIRRGINQNNANDKGKLACLELVQKSMIRKGGNQNLYLTIYTPDNFNNSSVIHTFWEGFFEEWGIPRKNWRFE